MSGDDVAAILAVEDRRRVALVDVDLTELDMLFAQDLVHIHSNGTVHDKAMLMAHIAARRAFTRIDRGPLAVRITGDVAVMTGRMTNHMQVEGQALTLRGMVTQVLRREERGWRFTNFQLTLEN